MDEHTSDRNTQGPPPSPPMQRFGEAPVQIERTPCAGVQASKSFWMSSFGVGALAIITVFLSRNTQLKNIEAMVRDVDSTLVADTVTSMAKLALWGSLGLIILVIAIEALLLRQMVRCKGWARLLLLLVLPLHAVVALVAEAFLAGPAVEGTLLGSFAPDAAGAWTRWLLTIQLGLATLAVVSSFWPGTRAWFATRRR